MNQTITIHIEEEAESAEHMAVILERIAQRLRKGDTQGFEPSFFTIKQTQDEQAA